MLHSAEPNLERNNFTKSVFQSQYFGPNIPSVWQPS